jgi:cobalt-zinc-cadmium efflux system protein
MTAWLALGLYVLGLLLAFGLRTFTHWRRTGDGGWRLAAGGPRTLKWWAKLLFGVALVLAAAGPISALAGLDPVAPLDRAPVRVAGGVLAVVGIVATLVAQASMGASWRIGVDEVERTALVTTGVFGWVRNPIFTAMIVTSLGLSLMVPNPVSLAATALLVVAIQLQVRGVEEPYLRCTHGQAYAAYASSVGRFVPGIGRIRTAGEEGHVGHGHGHSHGVTATGRHRGALLGALAASLAMFVVELVGSLLSGSLALLADAGHVLIDAGGVALALGAALLAARPPTSRRTFGWARAEILAAAVNGLVLTAMGLYVVGEGVRRLIHPSTVEIGPMALFAAIGLVGNLVGLALLFRARHASLNLRGAFLEVATDTATSVGVLVAAGIIAQTGFTQADPLISIVIGLVILPRALRLLRAATRVLLQVTPDNLDLDDVRRHIIELDHVRDVHDLHAYTVTSGLPVLTAHVVVDEECFRDGHAPQMLDAVQECLIEHFNVAHSTIQLEPVGHSGHEAPTHR